MQCIEIVGRNQPVELEIFWTSPSLTRKLSLFDHHIAEGEEGIVTHQLCATCRVCAYAPLVHDSVYQIGCCVPSARWSDEGKQLGQLRKDL
jgi:hypothetical protein